MCKTLTCATEGKRWWENVQNQTSKQPDKLTGRKTTDTANENDDTNKTNGEEEVNAYGVTIQWSATILASNFTYRLIFYLVFSQSKSISHKVCLYLVVDFSQSSNVSLATRFSLIYQSHSLNYLCSVGNCFNLVSINLLLLGSRSISNDTFSIFCASSHGLRIRQMLQKVTDNHNGNALKTEAKWKKERNKNSLKEGEIAHSASTSTKIRATISTIIM